MFNSPLRYPGGKNKLAAFFAKICIDNNITGHYIEPYSGGGSVALFLLLEGFVQNITINDMDRSIYAFWYSVLNHTQELCTRIQDADLTVENWHIQKAFQDSKEDCNLIDLGFSTLFLNRTNRSGIITGGIIGGVEQRGNYKIDCRFNKETLISRIKNIAKHRENIRLLHMDAIDLIDLIETEPNPQNAFFYFDPPYYNKASSLYMNHYKNDNHLEVSNRIKNIQEIKWAVSYDDVPEIQSLYAGCSKKEYSFKHTAGVKKTGMELLFFSSNLIQPRTPDEWNPIYFRLRKSKIFHRPAKIGYKGIRNFDRVNQGSLLFVSNQTFQ
ncbi:MAG: DNA adenine methylase [Daejeonella sp.]